MCYLIIAIGFLLLGWLTFPLVLFLRARRSDHWDDSNMTNIYRVIAHIATHPEDFARMYYVRQEAGIFRTYKQCFPYIGKDELSDVVDVRPET